MWIVDKLKLKFVLYHCKKQRRCVWVEREGKINIWQSVNKPKFWFSIQDIGISYLFSHYFHFQEHMVTNSNQFITNNNNLLLFNIIKRIKALEETLVKWQQVKYQRLIFDGFFHLVLLKRIKHTCIWHCWGSKWVAHWDYRSL